jgi:predicted RNase H-like nuclease (RuvC/YqgF family)
MSDQKESNESLVERVTRLELRIECLLRIIAGITRSHITLRNRVEELEQPVQEEIQNNLYISYPDSTDDE